MYINFKVTDKTPLGRKPDIKILEKIKKNPFPPFKKKKKKSFEKLTWSNKY